MVAGKIFQCEVTVSSGVKEKLLVKHNIEIWDIEEAVYDEPNALSISHRDCYFIYGQTYSGRYILSLVRILSSQEVIQLGFEPGRNVLKIITARDMNKKQRRQYNNRKGVK